jgi:hypothetical protein
MMIFIMLILAALGLGLVLYAVLEVFQPAKGGAGAPAKLKIPNRALPAEEMGKDQKIQRLQSQITKLESQLDHSKGSPDSEKSVSTVTKEKEAEFFAELKRREEWVAKAEAELAKVKTENTDLNNKFISKEKELEEEFTKNVNLSRETREMKAALEAKEMACKLKEDQVQAQKHQLESQQKSINEQSSKIAEFGRKEKISEWVPKSEFNQLNAEYTKLEKEFEASQERLKSFAVEIAHLRQGQDKKPQDITEKPAEMVMEKALPPQEDTLEPKTDPEASVQDPQHLKEDPVAQEAVSGDTGAKVSHEEIKPPQTPVSQEEPPEPAREEIKPLEQAPQEAEGKEAEPAENIEKVKPEENKAAGTSKAVEWLDRMEENIEKKSEETEDKK